MRRSVLSFLVKFAISGILIVLLVQRVDFVAVGARIAAADAAWLASSLFLFVVMMGFGIVRWWIILRTNSEGLPLEMAARLSMIGQFFNQTLPSNIGGDAARIYYSWQHGIELGQAFNSVMLDRVAGLLVLVGLTTAVLPFLEGDLDDELAITGLRALVAVGWIASIGLFAFDNPIVRAFERYRIVAFGLRLSRDARRLCLHPGALASVIATTLAVHLLVVAMAWSLDRALGGGAPYSVYFLAVIPTQMVLSIPISIGGWGVREQALALLLGSMGVGSVHAVSVSVLLGIVLLIGGAPGGLLWLALRRRAPAPTAENPIQDRTG